MKVYKYKDNIDTDVIIPARYLNNSDPRFLAEHCMEDIDETFATTVEPGDVIVAGENFGCGSSREHAPIAIKAAGIKAVIAKSYARIFFRNAINIGLPIIEHESCADEAEPSHEITVDLKSGVIENKTIGKTYTFEPFPAFLLEIVNENGLIEKLKNKGEING
jgi:3-isopropylmalate/(R)-2-methylmalate dehydratase small subunit